MTLPRRLGRAFFRSWCRSGAVPGYHYGAVERWGRLLAEQEPLPSVLPNGCRVPCDLTDHIQRQMYFIGLYEPIESYLFFNLLRPGMVVVDAGANIGQYTLLAATAVGPSGMVHSFEPIETNFQRLRRNIEENGLTNVHINNTALWNEDGTVTLAPGPGVEGNAGAYRVSLGDTAISKSAVPSVRLDSYAAAHGLSRLDAVKMDIEGAEPFAVRGGLELLKKFRPVIFMEICRAALEHLGTSPAELWSQISALGYRAWRIGHSPQTSGPVAHLDDLSQSNVLFYRGDPPLGLARGWDTRSALRWARSGWRQA